VIFWVHNHSKVICPECGADISHMELFRSGMGVEEGRFKRYCPIDGYVYYNLGSDIGKKPGDEILNQPTGERV
jgi:hypothetical protein